MRDTGIGIPAERAAAAVRALPSRRRRARPHARRHRHRPGAGAGAGAAARRPRRLPRAKSTAAARSPSRCRSAARTSRRIASVHTASRPQAAASSNAFVEEALRWAPGDGEPPTASPRHPFRGTADEPTPACANPARRRQRRHARVRAPPAGDRAGRSRRSATACAALDAIAAQRARPRDHRRDDAGARRLRPAARAARRRRRLRDAAGDHAVGARRRRERRSKGCEAGADDYLVKPFSARELVARVEAQLMRSRIRAVEEAQPRAASRDVFAQAPVAVAVLRGPDHVFEIRQSRLPRTRRPIATSSASRCARRCPSSTGRASTSCSTTCAGRGSRTSAGRSASCVDAPAHRRPPTNASSTSSTSRCVDAAGAVDGDRRGRSSTSPTLDARPPRGGGRQPGEGRVPRHARPRAAQPAGADPHRAPADAAARRRRRRAASAQVIERQVEHLVRLVDDLLDVSRITRGKVELQRQPRRAGRRRRQGDRDGEPAARAAAATRCSVDVPRSGLRGRRRPGAPRAGRRQPADQRGEVHRAAAAGHRCRAAAKATTIVIRVRDNGIGIAPDMLPRVFDLFVQERQALDRAQGGPRPRAGHRAQPGRSCTAARVEAHSDGRGQRQRVRRAPARGATGRAGSPRRTPHARGRSCASAAHSGGSRADRRRQRGRGGDAGATSWAPGLSTRGRATTARRRCAIARGTSRRTSRCSTSGCR